MPLSSEMDIAIDDGSEETGISPGISQFLASHGFSLQLSIYFVVGETKTQGKDTSEGNV